eukprot:GEMP01088054.1.p1 GENE.GEMP01088054.1~~GEMP01088054.1.p1  ORF type:complete len:179 (+),score=25.69 GEMP01088054.1:70-537(+)
MVATVWEEDFLDGPLGPSFAERVGTLSPLHMPKYGIREKHKPLDDNKSTVITRYLKRIDGIINRAERRFAIGAALAKSFGWKGANAEESTTVAALNLETPRTSRKIKCDTPQHACPEAKRAAGGRKQRKSLCMCTTCLPHSALKTTKKTTGKKAK